MTLTEKLPKVRQFLLDHIAFCETEVTAGPWRMFGKQVIKDGYILAQTRSYKNVTFIALSRTLDPIMAKGLVLVIDWAGNQHRDTVTETETGMHREHSVSKCSACGVLQSLCDLFPDEMLTRI